MKFPDFEARSLAGVTYRLPADLPADPTLVLLPFKQWQQSQVDRWIARAGDCPVIEVPCISRRWSVGRSFIDGGMATSIGDPVVLARTWTAYTDVGRVQRSLGVWDSSQTWVGVVARDGTVSASTLGEPTDRSWELIAAALG